MAVDWAKLDVAAADEEYWNLLRDWPARGGVEAVRDGIDVGALVRPLLWARVGHAVRSRLDAEREGRDEPPWGVEADRRRRPARPVRPGHSALPTDPADGSTGVWRAARRWLLTGRLAARRALKRTRVLYCPFPYSRNARILEPLLECRRSFEVVVPREYERCWPGAVAWPPSGGRPRARPAAGRGDIAAGLAAGVERALAAAGLDPAPGDGAILREEIEEQMDRVSAAGAELERLRPDAVLVPVDNAPPFIEYVLAANRLGIATVLLQHGLDCEPRVLDEAYAAHIAVWGPAREARYRRDSAQQPATLRVVGNPHYDGQPAPDGLRAGGEGWLWLTRPHSLAKCYLPSRWPDEGLKILDALADALAQRPGATLTIKAHTFDTSARYLGRVEQRGLGARVSLTQDRVDALCRKARVVIAEDSTAAMDAMVEGSVLVSAHFAATPPVLPVVECGAGLPGHTPAQLVASVLKADAGLAGAERAAMSAGQQRFLSANAGPMDGRAAARFCAFVEGILNRRSQRERRVGARGDVL